MPPDYEALVDEYFSTTTDLTNLGKELTEHIYTLCYWAVTHLRSGDHRVYIVSNVLKTWKHNGANIPERNSRQAFLQNALLDFLDKYPFVETGNRAEEGIYYAKIAKGCSDKTSDICKHTNKIICHT
jgi:hypothetical protein